MKSIMKKIVSIFIIALSVFACSEDFLDRYPTTSRVIENFYKTPEDGTQALAAAYNVLLLEDWWSFIIFSEIMSNNCAGGAGSGDGGGFQRVDRGIQWPDANAHQNPWTYYYGGIYRANVYLNYEGLIDWRGNEALQKQYQAEARFLRAYYHFYLTRMFGEIPALDHMITPDENPGRTPAEDLYSFMLQDLKFASENALAAPYQSMDPANWGRVTKWAAKAMFAKVYLFYSGYYNDPDCKGITTADARLAIDDVINSSGHDLVPVYASLWRVPAASELLPDSMVNNAAAFNSVYAGEQNPETVWSVRIDGSYNISGFERMIGPRNVNLDPYGQGWGAMTVLPSYWNAFDTTDTRRTATILSWDDEGLTYDHVTQQQGQYTGYNPKKYMIRSINGNPEAAPVWQSNTLEDFIVVRFADVLLMGAELHLNGGDPGTAQTYYNRVRKRAFGDAHVAPTLSAGQAGIDLIFQERRLELGCEGVWYYDILRSCKGDFSKLASILTYVDETDGGDNSQTADAFSLDVDGNNFVTKKGLLQIPQNEIDLMKGAIDQNPGYTSD